MLYSALELDDAALRHARYYVNKLYSLKALYQEQPENSIRQLRVALAQLQQAYTRLNESRHHIGDAALLFVSFVHCGIDYISLIIPPHEWAQWIESAIVTAQQLRIQREEFDLMLESASLAQELGKLELAEAHTKRCILLSEGIEDDLRIARSYFQSALVNLKKHQVAVSEEHLEIAKRYYDLAGDPQSIGRVNSLAAGIAIDKGEYDRAYDLLHQSIEIWRTQNNPRKMAIEQYQLGVMLANRLEYESAQMYLIEARDTFRRLGERRYQAYCLNILSGSYLELGKPDDALECVQQAYDLFQQVKDPRGAAGILNFWGMIYKHKGDLEQAITYHQQALEVAQEIQYAFHVAEAHRVLSEIYMDQNRWDLARTHLLQAFEAARPTGITLLILLVIATFPRLLLQQGHVETAVHLCGFVQHSTQENVVLRQIQPTLEILKTLVQDFDSIEKQGRSLSIEDVEQQVQALYF